MDYFATMQRGIPKCINLENALRRTKCSKISLKYNKKFLGTAITWSGFNILQIIWKTILNRITNDIIPPETILAHNSIIAWATFYDTLVGNYPLRKKKMCMTQ